MGVLKVWDGTTWQPTGGAGGADVYVGPSAPPGTPASGDMWWDTDETSPMGTPMAIANGGTAATSANGARSNLAVPAISNSTSTAGPPGAGTWTRGDQHLDSAGVVWTCTVAGTPGTWTTPAGGVLHHSEITASVTVNATTNAGANTVIPGTAVAYDGTPIVIEFNAVAIQPASTANSQVSVTLWDGSTDLGYLCHVLSNTAAGQGVSGPGFGRRRLTPTAGTHTYIIKAWISNGAGPGTIWAGVGGAATNSPATLRVTRA